MSLEGVESEAGQPRQPNKTAKYIVPERPYDKFMSSEGIPIYRVLGVRDVRELALGDWERLGGRGAFIQPLGTEGLWGLFVVEVPGAGSLTPERHVYEEVFFVVEGRGTTEVWEGDTKESATAFEWQAGSVFTIPLNTWHRIVNASSSRALLLASTTAAPVIDLFGYGDFVFDNPARFSEEFENPDDFFAYRDEILVEPVRKRALLASNFIPDIVNSDLPDDPSGRRRHHVELSMGSGKQFIWVGETELGRYSKAHYHAAGPVLVCLRGNGYTYTWPAAIGTTPWASHREDLVQRQDYEPGGLVAAAPAGGDWYHQHFGVGSEPLRLLRVGGSVNGYNQGTPGAEVVNPNESLSEGGHSIDFQDEDPFISEEFSRLMHEGGGESKMPKRD